MHRVFVTHPFVRSALAAAVLSFAGCAIHEPRTVASVPAPPAWTDVAPQAHASVAPDWWRSFGSAQLEALVQEALAENPDLRTAAQRVRQADIALQLAGASLLPGASASAGSSANRSEGGATRKSSSLSLNVSYEVDLWGRLAAGTDSARLALNASRYDLQTARITLVASVATSYLQLLAARERLAIAQQSLEIAERVLRIVQSRQRNGVATPLEVSQQTTAVLQQRTALAPLQLQVRQITSALALLLGHQPVGYDAGSAEALMQLQTPEVAPGLPSDLLARRPDLLAAQARLAAADADVAAARAALLPSFSLSAGGGVGSAALVSLAGGTGSASVAASLAQTLFDGGRRKLQVESSRLQRELLVDDYASAARRAFKEVDDALGAAATSARQEQAQAEVAAQAQRTLELAERRYREGADALLTVLEAQRTLFSARDALAQQRLARLTGAVDLYRVLGGGWQPGMSCTAPCCL